MNKRILVVDDYPDICSALAMLLRGEGYCVDETTDSSKAEILIKESRYDVCLFDYNMKNFNRLDMLRTVKDKNPRCLVFIVSGMPNLAELCGKEINAGLINGFISKPFDIDELLQKITASI